jgi:hypothetical protein
MRITRKGDGADAGQFAGVAAVKQAVQRCSSTALHPPEMYCSTSADTLTPTAATASAPAPLAATPGTIFSNLQADNGRSLS